MLDFLEKLNVIADLVKKRVPKRLAVIIHTVLTLYYFVSLLALSLFFF